MDPPESFRKINQVLPLDNLLRDGAPKPIRIPIQDGLHQPSQRPLIKSLCLGIDGNNPFEVEIILLNVPIHDFYIRMVNLSLRAKPPHVTGEDQLAAFLKSLPEVSFVAMKPLQRDRTASVPHDHLEDSFPPLLIKCNSRKQYLTQTCLLSSGCEFGDLFQVASVFVASREKVEGVLNRQNPFFLKELGELGPYPLHVLDRGEEAIPGILRLR